MDEPTVYRPVLPRVLAVVCGLVGVWWAAAVMLGPRPADAIVTVPALIAVGAGTYALLWRPAVLVDERGVQLRNMLRDVTVPWAALEGVETRYALTLLTADRSYQSWAAAAPSRPQRSVLLGSRGEAREHVAHRLPDPRWQPGAASSDRASRDLSADSGAAAFLVEQGWARWRERTHLPGSTAQAPQPQPGPPPLSETVRWNVPLVVLILVPAVLAVVVAFLRA